MTQKVAHRHEAAVPVATVSQRTKPHRLTHRVCGGGGGAGGGGAVGGGVCSLEYNSSSKEFNEYFTMPSLRVHVITAFPMMLDCASAGRREGGERREGSNLFFAPQPKQITVMV